MKLIKKALTILLLIAIVFSLSSCGVAKQKSIVGTWDVDVDDFLTNSGTNAAVGFAGALTDFVGLGDVSGLFGMLADTFSITFTFNDNGQYTMKMDSSLGMWLGEDVSETQSGTYSFDGSKLTLDGKQMDFSLKDSSLTIYSDNVHIKMTKR